MWVAVLCSLVMPFCCTVFVVVVKHANETLRLDARDWAIGYWGIASLVWQISGIVAFTKDDFEFSWNKWINGFFASGFNLLGCLFAIACFSTGAPIGPASALISTQTIIVVIIVSIATSDMPSAMEIVGLVLGLIGAMLLTMPDELYACWYRITRCRPLPPRQQTQQQADPAINQSAGSTKHEDL